MKTILFALFFALNAGLACAGQACAQLNQDITAYQKAQARTPGQIIRYSDTEGALARAVLDPTRVRSAIDELAQGSATESGARLRALAGRYTEVARNYVSAFQKHVFARYADARITGYEHLSNNVTRTAFEGFTVTTNWDATQPFAAGATDRPRTLCCAMNCATRPDAFASSTKLCSQAAAAAFFRDVPTACCTAVNWPSRMRAPGIAAWSVSSRGFSPA